MFPGAPRGHRRVAGRGLSLAYVVIYAAPTGMASCCWGLTGEIRYGSLGPDVTGREMRRRGRSGLHRRPERGSPSVNNDCCEGCGRKRPKTGLLYIDKLRTLPDACCRLSRLGSLPRYPVGKKRRVPSLTAISRRLSHSMPNPKGYCESARSLPPGRGVHASAILSLRRVGPR